MDKIFYLVNLWKLESAELRKQHRRGTVSYKAVVQFSDGYRVPEIGHLTNSDLRQVEKGFSSFFANFLLAYLIILQSFVVSSECYPALKNHQKGGPKIDVDEAIANMS